MHMGLRFNSAWSETGPNGTCRYVVCACVSSFVHAFIHICQYRRSRTPNNLHSKPVLFAVSVAYGSLSPSVKLKDPKEKLKILNRALGDIGPIPPGQNQVEEVEATAHWRFGMGRVRGFSEAGAPHNTDVNGGVFSSEMRK